MRGCESRTRSGKMRANPHRGGSWCGGDSIGLGGGGGRAGTVVARPRACLQDAGDANDVRQPTSNPPPPLLCTQPQQMQITRIRTASSPARTPRTQPHWRGSCGSGTASSRTCTCVAQARTSRRSAVGRVYEGEVCACGPRLRCRDTVHSCRHG